MVTQTNTDIIRQKKDAVSYYQSMERSNRSARFIPKIKAPNGFGSVWHVFNNPLWLIDASLRFLNCFFKTYTDRISLFRCHSSHSRRTFWSIHILTFYLQLISALFSLSRSSQETANATVDFYNSLASVQNGLPSNLVGLASKVHAAVADVSSVAAAHIQATDPENSNAAVPLLPVPYPNQQFNGEAFETSDVVARGSKSKASGSKVKAPRQIKPIRDPNAPRKPVTSFFLYSANERKRFVANARMTASHPWPTTKWHSSWPDVGISLKTRARLLGPALFHTFGKV